MNRCEHCGLLKRGVALRVCDDCYRSGHRHTARCNECQIATLETVRRLRGYGNAINAEVAKAFIEAYMSATEER